MTTRRIVLTFGSIAGAIMAAMVAAMVPMSRSGPKDFDQAEIVGYTTMVLALLMVVLGIRSHREHLGAGTITFGKAFQVGILITLVASAAYVITWEIVYFNFLPDYLDQYAAHVVEKLRASGAADAAIAERTQEMADLKRLYANPLINVAMTLMEIFPVGLVVTLISAAVLRRKVARQA